MGWQVERWLRIPGLVHGFGDRQGGHAVAPVTLRQVHGRAVYDVAEVRPDATEGDAIVCGQRGTTVGVWTADCVPVLLVVPPAGVVAAVHSGWRGTVAGVVDAALQRMEVAYGVDRGSIEAALGPSIGACCYEVGEEILTAFRSACGPPADAAFERRERRLHLDLRAFLTTRLRDLGVGRVESVGPCTACRTDVLCSYRKEGVTGRQLSYAGWS